MEFHDLKISKNIKTVLRDKDRKSLFTIIIQSLHCSLIEKDIPFYYYTSLLYKKNSPDYRNYIGHRKINKIIKERLITGNTEILDDKLAFGKLLEDNRIETPKVIAFNNKNIMVNKDNEIKLDSIDELVNVLNRFIARSTSKSVFIKPFNGTGGKNTFKLAGNQKATNENIILLYNLLEKQKFVFQESIIQNHIINEIYDKSVNTIRIHTYYDKKNENVKITSALMRFGFGGSIVDNGGAGGLFVPVDLSNWTLRGVGRTYFKNGGETFDKHPDSGVTFKGFKIPESHLIEKEIYEVAKLIGRELVGWDVVLTNKGPMILEGNQRAHFMMMQSAVEGIKNHPDYKKIYANYI